MTVMRKRVPRRHVLRGLTAAITLPLLDSMVPAFASAQERAAVSPRRLSVVYLPNGIRMDQWTPDRTGNAFDMTRILSPLAPWRGRLTVVTGLRNGLPHYVVHGAASTRFLTTVAPMASTGPVVAAGISMDQLAARQLGADTPLASLELSLESSFSGVCDVASSCVYTDTISWRGPSTPLPMEHDPGVVFERLFGDAETTDPAARAARNRDRRSILDSVRDAAAGLRQDVGAGDRLRIDEYLEAIRDVERRLQNTVAQPLPVVERPANVPLAFPEQARLMFDLQLLAFQADITRVVSFMTGRELSGRAYPEIGVRDAHHPISHHEGRPEKLEKLTKINTHHVAQLAYFLGRLAATRDGDGTLLDRTSVLCGAGMSDGNSHSPFNLPVLLAGGSLGTGRHVRVPDETPIANLHVSVLEALGVRVDQFGNSTGRLTGLV